MDIKENFKLWLINKGFVEKTPNGRPSTVYDYISKINQVCKYLNTSWDSLANNIDDTLYYYALCENNTYYFYGNTYISGLQFIRDINEFYKRNANNPAITYPIVKLNWLHKDKKYITTKQKDLDNLLNNYDGFFIDVGGFIGPLFTLNQTCDIKNKQKYINALLKFDEFIKNPSTPSKSAIDNKSSEYTNQEYLALKNTISQFEYEFALFEDIYNHQVTEALEILKNINTRLGLSIQDVELITGSDRRTLRALNQEGKLCYDSEEYHLYSDVDVINYLQESFHQRPNGKKFSEYTLKELSNFYNSHNAAIETGYSQRHIGRIREANKINYFNIHKASYRYCIFDIKSIKEAHNNKNT